MSASRLGSHVIPYTRNIHNQYVSAIGSSPGVSLVDRVVDFANHRISSLNVQLVVIAENDKIDRTSMCCECYLIPEF